MIWYHLIPSIFKQYLCRNNTFAKDKYLLVVDSPGSDTLTHTRTGTVEKMLSFCFIEHYDVTQPTIYVVQVIQVIQVAQVIQVIQVMQARLAHM